MGKNDQKYINRIRSVTSNPPPAPFRPNCCACFQFLREVSAWPRAVAGVDRRSPGGWGRGWRGRRPRSLSPRVRGLPMRQALARVPRDARGLARCKSTEVRSLSFCLSGVFGCWGLRNAVPRDGTHSFRAALRYRVSCLCVQLRLWRTHKGYIRDSGEHKRLVWTA